MIAPHNVTTPNFQIPARASATRISYPDADSINLLSQGDSERLKPGSLKYHHLSKSNKPKYQILSPRPGTNPLIFLSTVFWH